MVVIFGGIDRYVPWADQREKSRDTSEILP